ncbi:tetratricopeptide repeat protein [Pirellulales bacterium]|nr:tetratricopeptide repeat protein [Pirellulales bacterium]
MSFPHTQERHGFDLSVSDCVSAMQTGRLIAALYLLLAAAAVAECATFEAASASYEAGRWDDALQAFDDVAKTGVSADERTAARFYAAQCRLQLDDYATASQQLEGLLAELGPDAATPALIFRAGEAARLQGESTLARQRLGDFVRRHADHAYAPFAWKYLGELAVEADEWPAAAAYFRRCLDDPFAERVEAPARLALANALVQLGQPDAAIHAVTPLAENASHPLAAAALLALGEAQYKSGDYQAALESLQRLFENYPTAEETPAARIAAGWALWNLHRADEVAVVLAPLADDGPLAHELAVLRGITAYAEGKYAKAYRLLSAQAHLAVDGGCCQFYAGESARRSGQLARACACFEDVVADDHDGPWADDALWSLSQIAAAEGDAVESARRLSQLVAKYPDSSYAKLDRHLAATRSTSALHQAVAFARDGRHDAALAALATLSDDDEADPALRGEAWWQAGSLFKTLQQFDDAEMRFRRLVDELPDHARASTAQLALAMLAAERGDRAAASTQFHQIHNKFPDSIESMEAAYWLAANAADERRSDDARRWAGRLLEEVLQWDGESGDVERVRKLQLFGRFLLARTDLGAKQWEAAEARLEALLAEPDARDLALPAEFWLAECRYRLGNFAAARAQFESLARRTANSGAAWAGMPRLRIAQIDGRRQRWLDVLETLEQLKREHPAFGLQGEVEYLRGRALAGRGQMREARDAYRSVLGDSQSRGSETSAMAQWMIGETYFHQGDFSQARTAYQEVIDDHRHAKWRCQAALQIGKCWELDAEWDKALQVYESALTFEMKDPESSKQLASRLRWVQEQSGSLR